MVKKRFSDEFTLQNKKIESVSEENNGRIYRNTIFDGADLQEVIFKQCHFDCATFKKSKMKEVQFKASEIKNVVFEGNEVQFKEWEHFVEKSCIDINMENASFDNSTLDFVKFSNYPMCKADYHYASGMYKVSFENAHLKNVVFDCVDMAEACFNNAVLENVTFVNCKTKISGTEIAGLRSAHFENARLKNVIFDNVEMDESVFCGAVLENVSFTNGTSLGADFTGAFLKNVCFVSSKLCGANFTGVDISTCTFSLQSFTAGLQKKLSLEPLKQCVFSPKVESMMKVMEGFNQIEEIGDLEGAVVNHR